MTDLEKYRKYVLEIRSFAFNNNVSSTKTNEIFDSCFQQLSSKYQNKFRNKHIICRYVKTTLILFFISIISLITLYNHPRFHCIFLRNLQNSIYPGLNIFRKLAVPIVNRYPVLTEFYDEWCLVENPYFYVYDMDCWPCSIVQSVPDLTGYNITRSFNIGVPFTKAEVENICVGFEHLFKLYWSNKEIFDNNARSVSSNNLSLSTIEHVMLQKGNLSFSNSIGTHVSWRITRIQPWRILRKLFPKINVIPDWWSQSTEKYIFIDEPNSPPYSLASSECSNVILHCTSGERLIKLVPSLECTNKCKSFTILLSQGHSLWYNWWYWRPLSLPVSNSTTVSISYQISFC
ncbi:uncharacterized protein [Prorops nasuta]|uniref:uncharacterized protein n=1 Tax=Prorops nasuta TaxID=863751 RepID=UPI0034CD03B0